MPTVPDAPAVRMRALATELPTQLREGFRLGQEADARLPREAGDAVVAGLGGSAIAADLVRGITDTETPLLLQVARSPVLPKGAGKRTLAILSSYSGNTWETLAAYDAARRQGATRVVMTSGGTLAERAERDGVPAVIVPPGLPPRSAGGYMLGGLLGILDGYFPESNEPRVDAIANRLTERQAEYASDKGAPAKLARQIGKRVPQIYGDAPFGALARRWKTQIEENAKRLAHFDVFPELLHNAIVAWDALPAKDAARWAVIVLEGNGLHPSARAGMAHLGRLLRRKGVVAERLVFDSSDRLEALLEGVSFGDHLSLHLAALAGVDPLEVEAIVRLKGAVARG